MTSATWPAAHEALARPLRIPEGGRSCLGRSGLAEVRAAEALQADVDGVHMATSACVACCRGQACHDRVARNTSDVKTCASTLLSARASPLGRCGRSRGAACNGAALPRNRMLVSAATQCLAVARVHRGAAFVERIKRVVDTGKCTRSHSVHKLCVLRCSQ